MKHQLPTPDGHAVYAHRKCTVEPTFGIIKAVLGFRQFLLGGLQAVGYERTQVCIGGTSNACTGCKWPPEGAIVPMNAPPHARSSRSVSHATPRSSGRRRGLGRVARFSRLGRRVVDKSLISGSTGR